MSDDDVRLEARIRNDWPVPVEKIPSFAATWKAAAARAAAGRRPQRLGLAAALVAAAAVPLLWQAAKQEQQSYIEMAEVLESTSWSAPSDVLLPERRIDIYQELPVLIESTETAGGSML